MAFLETLWAAIAVLGLAGPAPAPEPVLVANDTPRLKSSKIKAVDLAETLRDTSINKLRIVSDDMPDEPFDLSPLAGADHILHLSIYREGKVDLTPILWMKGLRELHLSIDAAREIGQLDGPLPITTLDLYAARIDLDVSVIGQWTDLETVRIKSRDLVGIEALQRLPKLTDLSLTPHGVMDTGPLSKLTNLRDLEFRPYQPQRITGGFVFLSEMTKLEDLDLSSSGISNLSPLSGTTRLRRLWLSFNRGISDVSPLRRLTALQELRLKSTNVADISPLAGLTEMRMLLISRTPLADIGAVAGMKRLWSINLNNTRVTDLEPLRGLPISRVHLQGTPVTDLSPIRPDAKLYLD